MRGLVNGLLIFISAQQKCATSVSFTEKKKLADYPQDASVFETNHALGDITRQISSDFKEVVHVAAKHRIH